VVELVGDPVEEWFAARRRPDWVNEPPPDARYGLRGRVAAAVRDALPRPAYEAAVGPIAHAVRRVARRNPGRGRVLPDFMIIGAAKCGTSSLYHWLSDHTDVVPATTKEVHFFDYNAYRGDDWYRAHFPLAREIASFERERGRPCLTGEASVSYLSHRWAPERVARALPDVKMIVALRNPIDRAYSQFQMSRREGQEPLEVFEEAVAHEEERLSPERARSERDRRYNSWPLGIWSYLHRSRYAEHLELWLDLFPREQFLFIKAEEMFADPHGTLEIVDDFLGLPSQFPAELPRILDGGEYESLSADTRAHLGAYFKPHNDRLRELTGIDFGWDV
jgi:hypothetical protein